MFLRVLFLSLCLAWPAFADKTITVFWEYTETELTVDGFRLYIQEPGGLDFSLVQDIEGRELREWTGDAPIVEGENVFVLTAYDETNESSHSATYPLEYILSFNAPIFITVTWD